MIGSHMQMILPPDDSKTGKEPETNRKFSEDLSLIIRALSKNTLFFVKPEKTGNFQLIIFFSITIIYYL
jgi:hypothetical protein